MQNLYSRSIPKGMLLTPHIPGLVFCTLTKPILSLSSLQGWPSCSQHQGRFTWRSTKWWCGKTSWLSLFRGGPSMWWSTWEMVPGSPEHRSSWVGVKPSNIFNSPTLFQGWTFRENQAQPCSGDSGRSARTFHSSIWFFIPQVKRPSCSH